uniref:Uncharacterized protein n=1 Tax=Romanomermis culicivorax TaxID=13658 RepID=A0A915KTH1_ROMCU
WNKLQKSIIGEITPEAESTIRIKNRLRFYCFVHLYEPMRKECSLGKRLCVTLNRPVWTIECAKNMGDFRIFTSKRP